MSVTAPSPQSNLTTVKRNIVEYLYALSTGGSAVANITPPSIIVQGGGDAEPGSILQGTAGTWTGSPVLTYQWLRDGVAIVGETSLAGYTVVDDDRGSNITLDEIPNGVTASAVTSNTIAVEALAGLTFTMRMQTHNGDNVPLGLWQDTAMTIPATQEFDPVAAWSDELSNSGMVLTTDHVDHIPLLIFVNGVPTVEFDGIDDYMRTADFNFNLADRTVCCVWAQITNQGNDGVVLFPPPTGNDDSQDIALISIGAYGASATTKGGAGTAYNLGHTISNPIPWNIYTDRFTAGAGAIFYDGIQEDAGAYASFGTATKGVLIASRFLGGVVIFQTAMQCAALLISNPSLSLGNTTLVNSYLATINAPLLP